MLPHGRPLLPWRPPRIEEPPVLQQLQQQKTSAIVTMTSSLYVWVRTVRSLQFYLPEVQIDVDPFPIYVDLCTEVIGLLEDTDQISFDEFGDICKERIAENHLEAIFQNAREHGKHLARIKLLVYSILFAGLQQKTPELEQSNRSEILLTRISKFFGSVFKILFQLDVGKPLADRDIVQAIGNGQGFEFLDGMFEGTVKHKHGNSNQHGVRPLSLIVPLILEKANGISLPFLCNEIRRHLIRDPYHIDEFSTEKPEAIFSTARRTTLAHNSRRVVHLHWINRIEVLRKDEFANVHLRVCNDKPKASYVIAPLRCETVFLDSLMYCKWIVLGAVRGILIVRNCQSTRISVCCDQVIILNCRNLEIHSMSPKRPIIHNSFAITFAPFNTIYEEQIGFLNENGQSFEQNYQLKEPINFGEGSWNLMEPSRFVCQCTPLQTSDKNFEILLNSLPEVYRLAHVRNTLEGQTRVDNWRINDVVSHSDLLYLKSKIEKKQEEDDEERTHIPVILHS